MSLQQEQAKSWEQALAELRPSAELQSFLASAKITNVVVSQASGVWEIYFECHQKPSEQAKQELEDFWKVFLGAGVQVQLNFEVKTVYHSLEQIYSTSWGQIIESISSTVPSIRGWLKQTRIEVQNDVLLISVKGEMACNYLTSQHLKSRLEALILHEYDLPVTVKIELDEEEAILPDQRELEALTQACMRETLDKYTAKAPADKAKKEKIILGKKITGPIKAISSMTEEENNVVVMGYVFNLETKKLKTGRTMFTFGLSDKTDSLSCKLMADSNTLAILEKYLKENKWYLLRGYVQQDRYTQEMTLVPLDITEVVAICRCDLHTEKRVELHLHTKMSTLDSVVNIKELIERIEQWGHPALAITDHGVIQAFPDAYEFARKKRIKLIYGLEGYLYDDHHPENSSKKKATYHVVLLVLNQEGLRNLYELVTLSHLEHFYRVPRIPRSALTRLRQGLLIGSACEAGEVIRSYLAGKRDTQLADVASFYDYLEIQPRGNNQFLLENGTLTSPEALIEMNATIYQLGQALHKPVVATGDVHFLDPEDEVFRRILMAGKGFEDADKQAPLYLKTTEEMLEEFSYLGAEAAQEVVITNTRKIADLVEPVLPIPQDLYPPVIPGAEEEITELTLTRARALYGPNLPDIVQQRIDKELCSINGHGFAVLYLIAHKLVKKSNQDGYIVGSRGSVGSSLVATLCGITEVNPLPPHYRCPSCFYTEFLVDGSVGSGADLPHKSCPECQSSLIKDGHDIPFEVFLGFKGDKVPDIDLNFSGEYQPRAHKYTEVLFGKENVFRAGTIATVANKTAFGFVKNYFENKGKRVSVAELKRLVDGCTGVKRTTGQHPGGVMVLPMGMDIHRFTPLQRPADDTKSNTITTHFDYHAISSRLVKLDILGHDDPTVLKMLEDLTSVACSGIPLDEPQVLSLFQGTQALGIKPKDLGTSLGTLGIPEFGTKFVRQMLEDTQPVTFSDLVRISGFSHGTDVWLNNAQELIKSGTAKVSQVISARDDIMIELIQKGVEPARAFKIMEDVRKGKGVTAEDCEVMRAKNVPAWYIESCQKIKYMFPKAHAVAYVMMAFRIAYFKVYFPAAFYASFFTVRADEFDADIVVGGQKTIKQKLEELHKKGNEATQKEEKLYNILELALEMILRGIHLEHVDLLESHATKFIIIEEGKALLPPLVSLQGLGATAAINIEKARQNKPFISRDDLRLRAKLSKTVLDVLEHHGCLQGLPENDQMALF